MATFFQLLLLLLVFGIFSDILHIKDVWSDGGEENTTPLLLPGAESTIGRVLVRFLTKSAKKAAKKKRKNQDRTQGRERNRQKKKGLCLRESFNCPFYNDKLQTVASVGRGVGNSSKCIKGSTHYLGDKQDFDVTIEGPSFETPFISDEGPSLESSKSCLSPR